MPVKENYWKTMPGLLRWNCFAALVVLALCLQACGDDEELDKNPPAISFVSPQPDQGVWNTVELEIEASDPKGVESVDIYAGNDLLATLTEAPYKTSWNAGLLPDGNVTLRAVAKDPSGNVSETTITVSVRNTLVTINVADNQLYSMDADLERGFVFLSDASGSVIAFQEYTNGMVLEFEVPSFNDERFYLTEVFVYQNPGGTWYRSWTWADIERGKNWVLINGRGGEEENYVGNAEFDFQNAAADNVYVGSVLGDDVYFDGETPQGPVRLRKSPNSLYLIRYSYLDEEGPQAYGLINGIVPGNNIVNLSSVNQPFASILLDRPDDAIDLSVSMDGFTTAGNYSERYSVAWQLDSPDGTSTKVLYPGTAFPSYFTRIEYESSNRLFSKGRRGAQVDLTIPDSEVVMTFAGSTLSYSTLGQPDFVTMRISGQREESNWFVVAPRATSGSIASLELPEELEQFGPPSFKQPDTYTVYHFDNMGGYEDLKSFVRQSTRSTEELYGPGENYLDITYRPTASEGRQKSENRVHGLRLRGEIKKSLRK